MGRRTRALGVSGVVLAAIGTSAAAPAEPGRAYHGSAVLSGGRVDVRLTPRNNGSAAVPEATVRLSWSEPLADHQSLPGACTTSRKRAVLCRTAALRAGALGAELAVAVRLNGTPSQVELDIDTVEDASQGKEKVLVLDTGDTYHF